MKATHILVAVILINLLIGNMAQREREHTIITNTEIIIKSLKDK